MTLQEQAAEFQRRRNMVGTEIRYMKAGRTFEVVLSNRGSDLGSRTDTTTRGKVTSQLYVLPPLPAWLVKS